jgi:predicted NBD/HSP70 family sugar kinase
VIEAAEALGLGLAALAATLDPHVIVIGGTVALAQPAFVERAVAVARDRCVAEAGIALRMRIAELGERSVLAGAWEVARQTHSWTGRPRADQPIGLQPDLPHSGRQTCSSS